MNSHMSASKDYVSRASQRTSITVKFLLNQHNKWIVWAVYFLCTKYIWCFIRQTIILVYLLLFDTKKKEIILCSNFILLLLWQIIIYRFVDFVYPSNKLDCKFKVSLIGISTERPSGISGRKNEKTKKQKNGEKKHVRDSGYPKG